MRDPQALLDTIRALHAEVRDEIVAATERRSVESMAAVDRDGAALAGGDDIAANARVQREERRKKRVHQLRTVP